VEFYDDQAVELYDLGADIQETRNVAAQHPGRVAEMRSSLAAWRAGVNAQGNRPNPNFNPAKYRELYVETDPSRFDPLQADSAQWDEIWRWRKGMNGVLSLPAKGKP
jgi:acyl-homoserine lactone acylase PvdQ